MRRAIFLISLILLSAAVVKTQDITDENRRRFEELSPIRIDVDRDGKPDVIQPRIYKTTARRAKGKKPAKSDVRHWIAFDLSTSKNLRIPSFFKYNYGTDEAVYWVYSLKSAGDVNRDGNTDLIFYSGDDTSDETVILANKINRFVVFKRKSTSSEDW